MKDFSKRDESLRILSDSRLPNLMPLYHRYEQAQALQLGRDIERSLLTRPVTLYDQFGKPVQAPLTAKGIERDYTRAGLSCAKCGEIDVLCGCPAFVDPRIGRGGAGWRTRLA